MIDYWRQLDLVSPSDLPSRIHLIGAGGLGSPIALALVKMGCPALSIYDADRVEPHNLPNQLYRLGDIGRPKVAALADLLREFAPVDVEAHEVMVDQASFDGIVITAVDNMRARRTVWERSVRYRASVPLCIDARMGGEVGRVLAVRPTSPLEVAAYEATLYSDEEATEDPCTAQATIYSTFGVAALVANLVKRHAKGEALIADHVLDLATSMLITDTPT